MRAWQAAIVSVALALAASACQTREVSTPRLLTDDDLRAMVLRAGDVPPDFKLIEETLTNNEEYAQSFTDPEKVRDLVENWGRVSGLRHSFSSAGAAEKARLPLTITSEVQRFSGIEQARQAWRDGSALDPFQKKPETAPPPGKRPRSVTTITLPASTSPTTPAAISCSTAMPSGWARSWRV